MPLPETISVDPADPRALRDAFGQFATGVTIVTAAGPAGPVAIAANSFSSVSLDPPLVLWSVARSSRRFSMFETAPYFAIHVLGAEQAQLCRDVSRDVDALAAMQPGTGAKGVPLIDGCLARFECRRAAGHDAGDHVILLGRVLRAEFRSGDALAFFRGALGRMARP